MMLEGSGLGRVLENPSPLAHRGERRCKTAAILVYAITPALIIHCRQLMPAVTRRVRDDRPWTGILARVSLLIPRIDARHTEVRPIRFDIERRNHAALWRCCSSLNSWQPAA